MNLIQIRKTVKTLVFILIIVMTLKYMGTKEIDAGEHSQSVYWKHNQAFFDVLNQEVCLRHNDLPVIDTNEDSDEGKEDTITKKSNVDTGKQKEQSLWEKTVRKFKGNSAVKYVILITAAILAVSVAIKQLLQKRVLSGSSSHSQEFANQLSQRRDSQKEKKLTDEPKLEFEKTDNAEGAYISLLDKEDGRLVYRTIIRDSISIGRARSNRIIISDDLTVSAHHCEIIKRGNLYYIDDKYSMNGTFYNGVRVTEETAVINGGNIKIGEHIFIIEISDT